MPPFDSSHQPAHTGQPANAFSFAEEEDPIMPTFDAEGPPFDWNTWNPWADEPLGFWDAGVASQGALSSAPVEHPINFDNSAFDLQEAMLDWPNSSGWTNGDAGMPDALGSFDASPISCDRVAGASLGSAHDSEQMLGNDGMVTPDDSSLCLPLWTDASDAAEASKQRIPTPALPSGNATLYTSPEALPTSPSRARKHKMSQHLRCDVERCTHEGTFSRNWELARHMRVRHPDAGTGSFVCRAEGCFNKQLSWIFPRPDKLTAHIKAVHTRDTIFTACPVNGCVFGKCTLETLGVHIQRAHKNSEDGRALLNATTCKVLRCPLWRCGKHVTAHKLPSHVAGHTADEVMATKSSLKLEGLIVASAPGSAHADQYAQRGVAISVLCPVCHSMSGTVDDFITHVWADHILHKTDGSRHFVAWKAHMAQKVVKTSTCYGRLDRASVKRLVPWLHLESFLDLKAKEDGLQCPSCSFSAADFGRERRGLSKDQQANRELVLDHHLSLLRPEAEVCKELYPHRMQILRLYPEFVTHPVFKDFDQPQEQPQSSLLGLEVETPEFNFDDNASLQNWSMDYTNAAM